MTRAEKLKQIRDALDNTSPEELKRQFEQAGGWVEKLSEHDIEFIETVLEPARKAGIPAVPELWSKTIWSSVISRYKVGYEELPGSEPSSVRVTFRFEPWAKSFHESWAAVTDSDRGSNYGHEHRTAGLTDHAQDEGEYRLAA